jgi:hypothetical protein
LQKEKGRARRNDVKQADKTNVVKLQVFNNSFTSFSLCTHVSYRLINYAH